MRFVFAHKLTTYLTVFCSFMALIVSGSMRPIVVALVVLAGVVSWMWEEPRVKLERYATAWAIASLGVLAITLLRIFLGGEFLIVGVEYLLFLLVAKLFNRRKCRDYLHVYVLTFLMLVAGTVLNAELSYGLFFFAYVISITWALILFHLRREMEENLLLKHSEARDPEPVQVGRILNSRRIVGKHFFAGTSAVSIAVFLSATLLFLAIPRIGIGMLSQKRRAGVSMAGFSDSVTLGGHGTIKSDNTVVMRIQMVDIVENADGDNVADRVANERNRRFRGPDAPALHWRGVAFDEYRDGGWGRSRFAPKTLRQATSPDRTTVRHHMLYTKPKTSRRKLDVMLGMAVKQEIYLEPMGTDVLFGASMPTAFEVESLPGKPRALHSARNDEMRIAHSSGMKYEVYSQVDLPNPDELRRAPRDMPNAYHVYLQLPGEIPQRVRELARDITRDAETDYDRAVAIRDWLRSNLGYTLEMRDPGDQEPIDFFLFDRRQGHCEYFASAMAILLRTLGVPTRHVNGFLGGEWNEYDEYLAVRARDAHSWVEVYFHGIGWVTFDPTPSVSVEESIDDDSMGGRLRRYFDTLRFQWFRWVIEYDVYRQLSLLSGMGDSVSTGTSSIKSVYREARAWISAHWRSIVGVIVAVSGVGLVVVLLVSRRGSFRYRSRDPLLQLYEQVERQLAQRGYMRTIDTTPREYADTLTRRDAPGAAAFVRLTEIYYARRYGELSDPQLLSEARELKQQIDQAWR